MSDKKRVLFICTANAARSQMAEGLMRAKYGKRFDVFSAGTRPSRVSARAIQVMNEIGIDISHHRSKTLDEISGMEFDLAITLCDNAHKICRLFPVPKRPFIVDFPIPTLHRAAMRISLRGIEMYGTGSQHGLIRRLEQIHSNT